MEIKAKVWFYDGKDLSTGEWYTLEEAFNEMFVIVEGNELNRSDECSIIVPGTGARDSAGVEIYEGDKVEYDRGDGTMIEEVVEYNDGAMYPVCTMPSTELRITGNIYENPELQEKA